MINITKQKIRETLEKMYIDNLNRSEKRLDTVELSEYSELVRIENGLEIWTDALQQAICEHEIVIVPARDTAYYIDDTIIIGSNRSLKAYGATLKLTPGCGRMMFRNSSVADGTHYRIKDVEKDSDISIFGGSYEDSLPSRDGQKRTGRYDDSNAFFGAGAMLFFNNMKHLTIKDVKIIHRGGFAIQVGDIDSAVFEGIRFDECRADGVHINGNSSNILCRDIMGEVGDDIVALNAYDWQNSSVNFGPIKNVFCENIELPPNGRYKAVRMLPGKYYFDDGETIECSLSDIYFKDVRGIRTFKLYFQTPRYKLGEAPERGDVGSADNIYFENITIDLADPIDKLPEYMNSDPKWGSIAAFEFGSEIGNISLENIDLTLHRDRFPYSYLIYSGAKSSIVDGYEIFDPDIKYSVKNIELKNIKINGGDMLPEHIRIEE